MMKARTIHPKVRVVLLTALLIGSLAFPSQGLGQQTNAPSGNGGIILAGNAASGGGRNDSEQAYEREVRRARGLLKFQRYEKAIGSFKRANKMKKNASAECYLGLAQVHLNDTRGHRNVIKNCDKALRYAVDNGQRQLAHLLKGLAFRSLGEESAGKLRKAESEFRAAIAVKASTPVPHYRLGETLIKQERDREGVEELRSYLRLSPDGSLAEKARLYIENPRRVRENFAPPFSLVTMEDETLSLDGLAGKVVLLDFWATWCGPCIAALPSMKAMCARYPREQFVLISISVDADENVLRTFLGKEQLQWAQYHDRDGKVRQLFEVEPIPTYVVINAEGIVQGRLVGWGGAQSGRLNKLIKKSLKALRAESR